jgi:hypothetical protein
MDQREDAGRGMEARDGYGRNRDAWEAIQYVVEQQGEPMALFVAEEL